MLLAVILAVAAITALSIALSLVESRRRLTPLAFVCRHCAASFEQPAHHDFPRACPKCGATDWATSARGAAGRGSGR